jgi:hypothetical protein
MIVGRVPELESTPNFLQARKTQVEQRRVREMQKELQQPKPKPQPKALPPLDSYPSFDVALDQSIVYAHLDAKGKILYIGYSSTGLYRPFSFTGDQPQRRKAKVASVRIWLCASKEEAVRLEARMIAEHQPPRNRKGV